MGRVIEISKFTYPTFLTTMPYDIKWEKQGLVATFTGACTIQDVRLAYEEIGADNRFDDLRYQIFNYLGVTHQDVTEAQVNEIVGLDFAHYLTNPRVLHVQVSCDPRIDELIRLYIRTNANPDRQFHCESMEVAREWLRQRLPYLV